MTNKEGSQALVDCPFGKATDLLESLKQLIDQHGDDLRVAFYVDDETIATSNDSIVGAVKIDWVENTSPPRLNLAFETN